MRTKAEVLHHFDNLAVGGHWSALYDERGDAVANYSFIVRRRRVEALLDPVVRAGSRVLDVGCGTGVMAPWVLERRAHYRGVDASEEMIRQAALRLAGTGANGGSVEFSVGDAEDLGRPDADFDVVMALGVFEYLGGVEAAAGEIVRTTRPGGTVLISVPNALCADAVACRVLSPLVTPVVRVCRNLVDRATRPDNFSHRKFRPRELDRLLQQRGCRKSGHAYYNAEIACYPFRRLAPAAALRLKQRAEPSCDGVMRPFATGYIGRYVKDRC